METQIGFQGMKVDPMFFEKFEDVVKAVRRLGYLLDQAGHTRQANALEPFVKKAKTAVPLDPSVKPLMASLAELYERDAKSKLVINEPVEIDF